MDGGEWNIALQVFMPDLEAVSLASICIPLAGTLTAEELGNVYVGSGGNRSFSCGASQGGNELGLLEAQQGIQWMGGSGET